MSVFKVLSVTSTIYKNTYCLTKREFRKEFPTLKCILEIENSAAYLPKVQMMVKHEHNYCDEEKYIHLNFQAVLKVL